MSENLPQLDIETLVSSRNIAEEMDDQEKAYVLQRCVEAFDEDEASRDEYLDKMDKWEKHVLLALERKNYPWPDASNVMYPLIAIACIQFNARAYPALIPNNKNVVSSKVWGTDPSGEKTKKATRVSKYMSWQFMYDIPDWEEGMDKLLLMLPAYGNVFKKTFFSATHDKIMSYHISPRNLVVNMDSESLEKAPRVSEILPSMLKRDILERSRSGLWEEIDDDDEHIQLQRDSGSEDAPMYNFIEQHCYLDLDGDGFEEPYIVTFHPGSNFLARIVANYTMNDVKWSRGAEDSDDGKKARIYKITPTSYYTKYSFIPSLSGKFYDMGFGELMFSTNETVNTLINQLVDSGRINNLQSGFMGKGIKIRQGDQPLRPGEWRQVPSMGDDIRKSIIPLPTKEPSNVLFQLLGMLISAGKELASVAEIFTGKMPGQNTPATTTMATIEQGMKVFTAIYKRVYRSLEQEFKLVFKLNGIYLNENTYATVLDDESIGPDDFNNDSYDICPSADPSVSSQAEAIMKNKALIEMIPLGLDPMEVLKRNLEGMEIPNMEQLIPGMAQTGEATPQPQAPDPKMIEMQQKQQLDQQAAAQKTKQEQEKHQLKMASEQGKAAMEQERLATDAQHADLMNKIKAEGAATMQQIFIEGEKAKAKEKAKSKSQEKSSKSG